VALLGFGALAYLVSRAERPALVGWAGGLGYFAVALHWIVQPFLVDIERHGWMAPFALILMAGGLALFWGMAGWLSARLGSRALGWATALAAVEVARGYVLSGFPWALPAYIWADTPVRLSAGVLGPYGLTLITLLIVSLAVMGKAWRSNLTASLAALAILFGVSFVLIKEPTKTAGIVRLVQPNAPQHEKWDPEKAPIFVRRQIEFTGAEKDDVDLVVWPEAAIPYRLEAAAPVLQQITQAAEGAPVIIGANRTSDGLIYNALARIDAPGVPGQIYDKVRLVPFGEFIPLGQLARLVGMRSFAAQDGFGFTSGDEVRLIETPLGRALPLICYEAIFPQHIRAAASRPDYMLQITNDAWFGTFSGPYQHLDQARFRAAEQGLPVVRVANTGVSAVIDTQGRVLEQLDLGETGFLDASLPLPGQPTIYSVAGDWGALLLIILTLIGLLSGKRRNTVAN
jgi:apolipoprotein N-acyltransferase